MATVGNLFINVKARTASFRKKMSGVSATIKKLSIGFGKIAKKVALFGAAIAAVALVAIVGLTKKGLAAVDSITKLARSLDTTTEAISAMQHAAVIGGVDIEKMDKAIGKMFKNVGEAKMLGTGDAIEVFKSLGLDIDAIAGMQADEMFGTIADSINKLGTAGERAAAANKIFGRTGVDLLNVLKDGSQGMAEMRKEAEMLGLTFTDKMGNQVEQANDAWARIGAIWRGLSNQLAVHFAPILIEIANRIRDFVIDAGGMGQVAEYIVSAITYAGAIVLDVIRGLTIAWYAYKGAALTVWGEIVKGIGWAAEKIETIWNTIKGVHEQAIGLTDWLISKAAGGAAALADAIGDESYARELRFWEEGAANAAKKSGPRAAAIFNQTINRDISNFLKELGGNLSKQGAADLEKMFLKMSEKWAVSGVPDFIAKLKEKFAGEGFDILGGGEAMEIELNAPDIRGAVQSLQTAIGGFKVEGDSQAITADKTLKVEEEQLKTSEKILLAIKDGTGGAALV